jgi:hypothetical protein
MLYLPSCAFVPIWVFLLLIGYSIKLNSQFLSDYFKSLFKGKIIDKNFSILLGFSVAALIFRLIDFGRWTAVTDAYSFVYLFPFTYIVARTISIKKDIINYLLYFAAFESVVGVIEYISGVSSFFTGLHTFRYFESYDLLYFTRVSGLSTNSSGFSIKLLITICLIPAVEFKLVKRIIIEMLILLGLVFSFGRMTLITLCFYYGLKLIVYLFKKEKENKLTLIPIIAFFLFFGVNPIWTKDQFIRGGMDWRIENMEVESTRNLDDGVEFSSDNLISAEDIGIEKLAMSGRKEIWSSYLNFSKENLTFGNYAKKYMIGKFHAHNSFLQILSSNGLYFLIAITLFIIFNINRSNAIFIVPILFSSFTQYFIFWGISYADILFYFLLFFYMKKNENQGGS